MTTWKQRAAEAIKAGYQPGNGWERMLERHLKGMFSDLVKELGSDLKHYLAVQTNDALEMYHRLTEQGTNPEAARELAMQQLLPKTPDEQDQPEAWETESGASTMEQATLQALLQNPSQSQQPRKTQLT